MCNAKSTEYKRIKRGVDDDDDADGEGGWGEDGAEVEEVEKKYRRGKKLLTSNRFFIILYHNFPYDREWEKNQMKIIKKKEIYKIYRKNVIKRNQWGWSHCRLIRTTYRIMNRHINLIFFPLHFIAIYIFFSNPIPLLILIIITIVSYMSIRCGNEMKWNWFFFHFFPIRIWCSKWIAAGMANDVISMHQQRPNQLAISMN